MDEQNGIKDSEIKSNSCHLILERGIKNILQKKDRFFSKLCWVNWK
jgi:hypothetical protein